MHSSPYLEVTSHSLLENPQFITYLVCEYLSDFKSDFAQRIKLITEMWWTAICFQRKDITNTIEQDKLEASKLEIQQQIHQLRKKFADIPQIDWWVSLWGTMLSDIRTRIDNSWIPMIWESPVLDAAQAWETKLVKLFRIALRTHTRKLGHESAYTNQHTADQSNVDYLDIMKKHIIKNKNYLWDIYPLLEQDDSLGQKSILESIIQKPIKRLVETKHTVFSSDSETKITALLHKFLQENK